MLFCTIPNVRGAFYVKRECKLEKSGITVFAAKTSISNSKVTSAAYSGTSENIALPRGRGNGKGARNSFIFGLGAMFVPILGLAAVPFAYINGFRNTGRMRKGRGFAIAGIIMATFGIVISIAILMA